MALKATMTQGLCTLDVMRLLLGRRAAQPPDIHPLKGFNLTNTNIADLQPNVLKFQSHSSFEQH